MAGAVNAYTLWFQARERGEECWVRKVSWSRYAARLVAMKPTKGPPPYYGNCGFEYEIWGPNGLQRWDPIRTWGNYSWVAASRPLSSSGSPEPELPRA
jgi:hypothetical protein